MAVNRAMERLRRVLELEEELRRTEFEAAVADLGRLEAALTATEVRNREGRRLVTASAVMGEIADRLAGLEETRSALLKSAAIKPRIAEAELTVTNKREEFLAKRIERRQVQTVVERNEKRELLEGARRTQRGHDDWFLNRAGSPGGSDRR